MPHKPLVFVKCFSKLLVSLLALYLTIGASPLEAVYAQSGWSDPYSLYHSDYLAAHPIVVADVYDNIHVMWIESDANNAIIPAVFHTRLVNSNWSTPVSVLVSPGGGPISGFNAVADRNGSLHAIWHGSNQALYYSSAQAAKAGDPRGWTQPVVIGSTFTFPGITTDPSNGIFVAYPGDSTDGVYIVSSNDGGYTWDAPRLAVRSSTPDSGVNYVNIVADKDGILHVAWSEFKLPDGWPPIGVFVSNSTDHGLSWSSPLKLAGDGYDQVKLAVNQVGEVYAFWNGMIGVGGRYISASLDRGQSWSEPYAVVPPGIGGTSGYPHVVFDSLNIGHMITSVDWQGGIQYLQQDSASWFPGIEISSAIDYASYAIGSLELPWLCITQGNMLHVVYEAGMEEIFYQHMLLSTPIIQPSPLVPIPTIDRVPMPENTPLAVVEDAAYPGFSEKGMVAGSISQPLNLAALCVLGLILSVYLAKKWRQTK